VVVGFFLGCEVWEFGGGGGVGFVLGEWFGFWFEEWKCSRVSARAYLFGGSFLGGSE
jgi:hypothetical protein